MSQLEKLAAFAKDHGLPTASPEATLPAVIIPGGNTTITKSAAELYEIIAPTKKLFIRGGIVVKVVEKAGEFVLEEVKADAACSDFEKHAAFFKET